MLAYSALASAIQTTTDPSTGHVAVDLKVSFLRPVIPGAMGTQMLLPGEPASSYI